MTAAVLPSLPWVACPTCLRPIVSHAERPTDAPRAEFTRTCRGCGTRWLVVATRCDDGWGSYGVTARAIPPIVRVKRDGGGKNGAAAA